MQMAVIPAQAGTHNHSQSGLWVPACAGMTMVLAAAASIATYG